jgi:TatA/E family protein of Tat protein translocase
MLDIGLSELLIILAVALIVLGPKKLPEVARSLGRGLAQFRRASEDLRRSILVEDSYPEKGKSAEMPPYASSNRHAVPPPEEAESASPSGGKPDEPAPNSPPADLPSKNNGIDG